MFVVSMTDNGIDHSGIVHEFQNELAPSPVKI